MKKLLECISYIKEQTGALDEDISFLEILNSQRYKYMTVIYASRFKTVRGLDYPKNKKDLNLTIPLGSLKVDNVMNFLA